MIPTITGKPNIRDSLLAVSELKQLKGMEEENQHLKPTMAEQAPDNRVFKKLVRIETKRLAVSYASTRLGLRRRKAYLLVGLSRSVYTY